MKAFNFAIFAQVGMLLALAIAPLVKCQDKDYASVLQDIQMLTKNCYDILQYKMLRQHLENFGSQITESDSASAVMCGDQKCFSPVLRLGVENNRVNKTEVLLVAGMHGNERTGTTVLITFLKEVCRAYKRSGLITHLVENAMITIVPMANAWGYYHGEKLENNIDPHTDFPYMKGSRNCLQTETARLLYGLFEEYPIQLVMSLQSERRVIGMPWFYTRYPPALNTSNDWMSLEQVPDLSLYTNLGKLLQKAGDPKAPYPNENALIKFGFGEYLEDYLNTPVYHHSLDRLANVFEPKSGSFEDWAYGYGWSEKTHPETCDVEKFGMSNNLAMVNKAIVFTISVPGTPSDATQYEIERQLLNPTEGDYDISRTIRVILKGLEVMTPSLKTISPWVGAVDGNGFHLSGTFLPIGCQMLEKAKMYVELEDGTFLSRVLNQDPKKCASLGLWEDKIPTFINNSWPHDREEFNELKVSIDLQLTKPPKNVYLVMSFDNRWTQGVAESPLAPQSLLAEARSLPYVFAVVNENSNSLTPTNGRYELIRVDNISAHLRE